MSHDKILLATDGGEPARAATKEAIRLAKAFDAVLHTVYVLQVAEPPPWADDPALEPGIDTKAGRALNSVTEEAANYDFERDIVTGVIEGQTAPAILQYAADNDIDMIVMGTHGRTGVDRLVVGSVAEHVVREATVPVVTVHAESD